MGRWTHSIRIKITAITVAAILTSILSVIGASFFTIERQNDRSSAEMMNLLSRNTQQELDAYLESIQQSVEMAANIATDSLDSVVLVESGVAGTASKEKQKTPEQAEFIDAYLAEHCEKVQEAFSSVANHTRGVITYYYCITPEMSETEHGFFYSKVGKTGFEEQKPLDARELDPDDIAHTTWYYTPIKRGRPSWVGPYRAHFLGEIWTFSYLVPVYKTGTLIGVLGMDLELDTLVSQISPIKVFDTGFACLFDDEGRVIYHPELELGEMADISNLSVPEEAFQKESSEDQLIRYTTGGEERQLAFSTLSSGLKLVVTAPVSEINAAWTNLTHILFIGTAVIVAVFAAILMLAMRLITRPLQRLTAASRRLAGGDYDVELTYGGRDEVGTLTESFSQMRGNIKQYISDLNRRIDTDELTGLPNMECFFKLAEKERARMEAAEICSVILFFDLVGMKHYNRQYSFEEGNKLIIAVGKIVEKYFGKGNCSRFGQDHFSALSEKDGIEEKLRLFFRDCAKANDGKSLPVRVGIYTNCLDEVDVSVACDRAKYACDRHRGSYASEYYFFDKSMLEHAERQRYIINNLDRALNEGWIKVYFQPIIRAGSSKVCDEEALSRWIDPEMGFLSPGLFVPVLEEARLIYKLDLYVLDQILLKMKRQESEGMSIVSQSLNLSRMDFDSCDIVEEVCRRVDACGIPRKMLTIEVTESSVGSDFEFMKEQIERFQALGFQVWMDDFGSGYSTLNVLQDIHFDLIKLDMSFMKRFEEGEESKIILTEMIRLAEGLGTETVAEGVETKEQAEFLRDAGCTKLQGFYYSKAISLEEILEKKSKGTLLEFESIQASPRV